MLEAIDLTLRFGAQTALDGLSLAVAPGEVLAIVGPNGAGKSSLLGCLSGALAPSAGEARIDGVAARRLPPAALALRRAVLEQTPSSGAAFTVRALVGLSIPRAIEPGLADSIAAEAIAEMGLQRLARRRIDALSGGERHRAHMARALAQLAGGRRLGGGGWLLLDEPTASLDLAHQAAAMRAARRAADQGAGVVAVLHDLSLAGSFADRIALLRAGRLEALGSPRDVLRPEILEAIYGIPVLVAEPAAGLISVTPAFHALS